MLCTFEQGFHVNEVKVGDQVFDFSVRVRVIGRW
jgi:hypothetical protein